jgi:hypothetical protein
LFWSGELSLCPAAAVLAQSEQLSARASGRLGDAAPFGQGFRAGSLRLTDYTTSVALWTAGWDFVSPPAPCSQWMDSAAAQSYEAEVPCARPPSDPRTWLASLASSALARSLADFAAFSATDPASGRVFVRAALGVTPQHDQREIVAKYGSLSGFSAEREALLFELGSTAT